MARPKGDAAEKLLAAARALALERGCGALSVRAVARRAGVNLGLFHYHFKSREAFLRRVLEQSYESFFARLVLSAEGPGAPRARLRRTLAAIARFTRDNRRLVLGMLRDAMNGERLVMEFAAARFPRHLPVILGLYKECVKEGSARRLSEPMVFALFIGALNAPLVVVTLVEDSGAKRPMGRSPATLRRELLSDAAIDTRVDLLMCALAPR